MTILTSKRVRVAPFLLLAVLAAAAAGPVSAQDNRLLATRVADTLALFPADSGATRDKLADDMLALGEAGLLEFTRQLVPAGGGADTSVRFALNAMAVRASQTEAKRALAERALVKALAAAPDPEVRTFLLSQLRIVGRDAAVKAAAPFLADATLGEPATQLMLSVRSLAAQMALLAALPRAAGPSQITIVKALGDLGVVEALPRLVPLTKDANPAVRRASLHALARFGSPKSYAAMTAAAKAADFRYEPGNAVGALLEYARQLRKKAALITAEKVCRYLMANTDDPERLPTRAAALTVLADVRGANALTDLLAAVDHADREYRNAALTAAQSIRGPAAVQKWIAKAEKADVERRVEIIGMLGRQRDPKALTYFRASLGSSEPDVVLAAADALAHAEGAKAVPAILPLLKTATGDALPRVADILAWTLDEKGLDPLVAMLDTLPVPARATAIGVIGAKGGRRFASKILPLTSDASPEIRAAAIGALAGVVSPADLPALLTMLDAAEAGGTAPLQKAVAASVSQITPDSAKAAPLVQAMKAASHPERIVEVLPQVGGPDALAAVTGALASTAEPVRTAAFRALTQWPGTEASNHLFELFAAGDPAFRNQAFSGFVRQISMSNLTPEQKVLQLKKALAKASTVGDRRILIRALERIRSFQTFALITPLLDDPEVGSDAAGALARIALPTPGSKDGLSGSLVRDALTKAMAVRRGPQAEVEKEEIRLYLASMPPDEGFVPLFNGTDLTGWQGLVGNPLTRAKMPPQELAVKQAEANEKAKANWSVRDGQIVFNGTGDNLCTIRSYGDFEMIVDWRITKGGDSGIYLRGTPQVQIWDPARKDVGAEVGSGGLYNNQKNPSKPLTFADNPVGEWNTFRITMIGDKVTVRLNGVTVVDNVTMENYWDRAQAIFPRGPIELQAHGTDLAFRDIYVREIGAAPALSDAEKADGFMLAFNGRTLDGWIGNKTGYKVEDGAIVFDPKAGDRKNLYLEREYSDFQLRFEFQLTPGANSGIGIRTPRDVDAAYAGMEIQVLDDTAPVYAQLQPYQYHGSVYGIIPAKRGSLKSVGEWNSEEIFVQGTTIRVTVNGTVIVDGDLAEATKNGPMDHKEHPGVARPSGYIGLLSHDTVVRFRNVRIKDLAKK